MQKEIDVFCDCNADDYAGLFMEEFRKIRSAADKTEAVGCSSSDHCFPGSQGILIFAWTDDAEMVARSSASRPLYSASASGSLKPRPLYASTKRLRRTCSSIEI